MKKFFESALACVLFFVLLAYFTAGGLYGSLTKFFKLLSRKDYNVFKEM